MHYEKERQEHNEQDWPDNEEWMEAVFQNGPTGCHYPIVYSGVLTAKHVSAIKRELDMIDKIASHQNLTVSESEGEE